jgi:hypothetical protein
MPKIRGWIFDTPKFDRYFAARLTQQFAIPAAHQANRVAPGGWSGRKSCVFQVDRDPFGSEQNRGDRAIGAALGLGTSARQRQALSAL